MRTSPSTLQIIAALLAARPAFATVIRSSVGQVGPREYKYADLPGVLDAAMPALLAQGVVVLQAVDAETSTLITRLAHVSGEWVEAAYPLKLDQSAQALGSAITYARRYSLVSLLCLAAEDDDGAAAAATPTKKAKAAPVVRVPSTEPVITDAQRKRMFAIAKTAGWNNDQMKSHLVTMFGVESSKDLPASKYDQVCAEFASSPVTAEGAPF